jgi:hypothetical protein
MQRHGHGLGQGRGLGAEALRQDADHEVLDQPVLGHAALGVRVGGCAAEVGAARPQVGSVLDTWLGLAKRGGGDGHRGARRQLAGRVDIDHTGHLVPGRERFEYLELAVLALEVVVQV